VVQSGFWHQFAMTAHSPVGLNPEKFNVKRTSNTVGTFANNDLEFIDDQGTDHEAFSEGLRKSLFNYMHGLCFEYKLNQWFDFKVPKTTVSPNFIENALAYPEAKNLKPSSRILWMGNNPSIEFYIKKGKGQEVRMAKLIICNKKDDVQIHVREDWGNWLFEIIPKLSITNTVLRTYQEIHQDFENRLDGPFQSFIFSNTCRELKENGLLFL